MPPSSGLRPPPSVRPRISCRAVGTPAVPGPLSQPLHPRTPDGATRPPPTAAVSVPRWRSAGFRHRCGPGTPRATTVRPDRSATTAGRAASSDLLPAVPLSIAGTCPTPLTTAPSCRPASWSMRRSGAISGRDGRAPTGASPRRRFVLRAGEAGFAPSGTPRPPSDGDRLTVSAPVAPSGPRPRGSAATRPVVPRPGEGGARAGHATMSRPTLVTR